MSCSAAAMPWSASSTACRSAFRPMSARLFEQGVCATAMSGWGERHGPQYIRFVFANEPVERLTMLGGRVRAALGLDRVRRT